MSDQGNGRNFAGGSDGLRRTAAVERFPVRRGCRDSWARRPCCRRVPILRGDAGSARCPAVNWSGIERSSSARQLADAPATSLISVSMTSESCGDKGRSCSSCRKAGTAVQNVAGTDETPCRQTGGCRKTWLSGSPRRVPSRQPRRAFRTCGKPPRRQRNKAQTP